MTRINQTTELWSGATIKCNWPDAIRFAEKLNEENHLGRTNWRLPKLWELLRAHDLKIEEFNGTSWYWSCSSGVYDSDDAEFVYFYDGPVIGYSDKDNIGHVRCVSSG